ncbi:hypothetical protein HAX54_001608, partial [Datura stramonium]|nr:hypothetical protein [Datura stramonium]
VLHNDFDASLVFVPSKSKPSTLSPPPTYHPAEIFAKLFAMKEKIASFKDIIITQFSMKKLKNVAMEVGINIAHLRLRLDQIIKEAKKVVVSIQTRSEKLSNTISIKFDSMNDVIVKTLIYFFRQ